MSKINPRNLLQQSVVIHSEQAVQQAIEKVANQISHDLMGEKPLVLCVMGGAVVFSGKLLPMLNFPLNFDYVQVSRYHNQTQGSHLVWRVEPQENVRGRIVLLLDDILDEGHTLAALTEKCLALGASKVIIAVLVEKELSCIKPIMADYVGLKVPNQYVFGCGMDVYGWWRNLPAIYALDS